MSPERPRRRRGSEAFRPPKASVRQPDHMLRPATHARFFASAPRVRERPVEAAAVRTSPVLHHSRVGHNQARRGTHHRRIGAAWVVALLATSVVLVINADPARAGPPAVVTGFVPLPANEFRQALLNVDPGAAATLDFAVGITNVGDGAVIYYDHWEDGFEADISNPVQASTEVWGDGNAANGDAAVNRCRTDCSGDRLTAGDVFVLHNVVPTPRIPVLTLFDGRDKVASTRGFAITGGGFPTNRGAELAGVVTAFDTSRYGTDYLVPVGQDTPWP